MSEIKLKNYLNNYFDSLIEYKHLALRTNTILFNDLKRFDSEDSKLRFASSLVLRDWSGKTDNGWHMLIQQTVCWRLLKRVIQNLFMI